MALPTRAYSDTIPRLSPGGTTVRAAVDVRPAFVIAAAEPDVERFPAAGFRRYGVHTTAEALRMIETARPFVVAIDWDVPQLDGPQVCTAARKFSHTAILATMAKPQDAPAALKAGCHGILLKPFAPNLVAARVGRLSRELPVNGGSGARAAMARQPYATNRVWEETHCPTCDAPAATSFEFHSYRRMWYACLQCDGVWLGPRQE